MDIDSIELIDFNQVFLYLKKLIKYTNTKFRILL